MYYLDKEGQEAKIIPSTESDLYRLLQAYDVYIDRWNLYDCLYVLNMAKADFLGSSIPNEQYMVKYIKDMLDDPDAEEGFVFNRYYADTMFMNNPVDWEEML